MASPARKGTSGGGERISMAVLRNSDSVTGIRFVPLHHPNAPRAFGSASACFTPMSSLLTSFCGRLRPCRRRSGSWACNTALPEDWPVSASNWYREFLSPGGKQEISADRERFKYLPIFPDELSRKRQLWGRRLRSCVS